MPSRKNWFRIDADGYAGLQAGREPWQLAREPISNGLDEPCTVVEVALAHDGDDPRVKRATLTVRDDSPGGFDDLADAYTFFRRTKKRRDPSVRGRFNMGEKDLLAISAWAKITSTTGAVEFCEDGEVHRRRERTARGTVVAVTAPWTRREVEDVLARLRTFLPPPDKRLVINGEALPHRTPKHAIAATLQTVLEDEDGLRPTTRATAIHVHDAPAGESGCLYELGIPVCAIDAPYLLDVQQKVPLTAERDRVLPSFLRDVLAEVVNVIAPTIPAEQVSATWVREATRDERITDAALAAVQRQRWGERAVLWSSDHKANEEAQRRGYQIVRPRELDGDERRAFERAGLVHASAAFPTSFKSAEEIERADWTPAMRAVAAVTQRLAPRLVQRNVAVAYIRDRQIGCAAQYGHGRVLFNLAHLPGWHSADDLTADMLATIAHEFAHEGHSDGFEHGFEYATRLERITGDLAMLALREPGLFRFET